MKDSLLKGLAVVVIGGATVKTIQTIWERKLKKVKEDEVVVDEFENEE